MANDSAPHQDRVASMNLTRHLEQLALTPSEAAYDRLTGYAFARRYVAGKAVADVGWGEVGFGSRLLAETAGSVVGLAGTDEAVNLARAIYPAPNAEYEKADLSELPHTEDRFDVVVALGVAENLERPEDLVKEARRVLKQDGVLVISVPDKRSFVEGRRRGMYLVEFQELLEANFGHVFVYRQGAVAGGFVFPVSGELNEVPMESIPVSSTNPRVTAEPPEARSLIAVCGDSEALKQEEGPYLMLDRDRRVFDECEDRAEDVELLRDEIRHMQETEAQAFIDALKLRETEISYLRARIRRSEAQARHMENVARKKENVIHEMENSTVWRLFEPYRRVRTRLAAARGRGSEGSSDRPGQ